MTQDFAKRKSAKGKPVANGTKKQAAKAKHRQIPPWVLLLTGAVFGSFVTFLLFLSYLDPSKKMDDAGQFAANQPRPGNQTPPLEFQFIEMLKEQKVEVPPEPVAPTATPVTPTPTVKKEEPTAFFIQAGSFKSYKEADNLRARLILRGMDTDIETSDSSAGAPMYRVVVGPYLSRNDFQSAMTTLANDNITTLPLTRKIKGPDAG